MFKSMLINGKQKYSKFIKECFNKPEPQVSKV